MADQSAGPPGAIFRISRWSLQPLAHWQSVWCGPISPVLILRHMLSKYNVTQPLSATGGY